MTVLGRRTAYVFFELCTEMVRIGEIQLFRDFLDRVGIHFEHDHTEPDFGLQNVLMRCDLVSRFKDSDNMLRRKGEVIRNV